MDVNFINPSEVDVFLCADFKQDEYIDTDPIKE